jgi:hypothetical protein
MGVGPIAVIVSVLVAAGADEQPQVPLAGEVDVNVLTGVVPVIKLLSNNFALSAHTSKTTDPLPTTSSSTPTSAVRRVQPCRSR